MNSTDTVNLITLNYSPEELSSRFQNLYEALDFRVLTTDLHLPWHKIYLRKKVLKEYHAISVSLWRIALQKSFPDSYDNIFLYFINNYKEFNSGTKFSKELLDKVNNYSELLEEKKDKDFSPLAVYLSSLLIKNSKESSKLQLRLSLSIRSLYTMIFEQLV